MEAPRLGNPRLAYDFCVIPSHVGLRPTVSIRAWPIRSARYVQLSTMFPGLAPSVGLQRAKGYPNWQSSLTTTIKGPPFAVFYLLSFLPFSLYSIYFPPPSRPLYYAPIIYYKAFFFNSTAVYTLSLTLLLLIYSSLLSCFYIHYTVYF